MGDKHNFRWYEVRDPSAPLPSSGKTIQDAKKDVDRRFREGEKRQEMTVELKETRDSKGTMRKGIAAVNETARGDDFDPLSICDKLITYSTFSDGLDRKQSDILGELGRERQRAMKGEMLSRKK